MHTITATGQLHIVLLNQKCFYRVDKAKEWRKRINRRNNRIEEISFGLKDYHTIKVPLNTDNIISIDQTKLYS